MTSQVAGASEGASVFKPKLTHHVRRNNREVKVYQVTVICRIALCVAYTVRVVADITRGPFINNVPSVLGETLIANDARAAMTVVTEGVGGAAFRDIICGNILPFNYWEKN
jgi:hypothetical protein